MLKKLSLLATGVAFVAVMVLNLQMLSDSNNFSAFRLADLVLSAKADGEGGSGNQATCYSTYTTPLIGGTNIFVCGTCTQAKAKNFSDSGICYF